MGTKLQKPEYVFMNGTLTPWDDAVLHVGCEAVNRGLNVFEGLKGYWRDDGRFGIIFMERHYRRLVRSAELLHLPCPWSYEEYESAVHELVGALLTDEQDMWMRVTLFGVEGHWGLDTRSDLVVTAYHQTKDLPSAINLGISTWQRSSDAALPYRIKTSSNYEVGRLARIEGRRQDCQEMVLLNAAGRVAESTGSAVIMVRDGVIYSPPSTEGALESITLDFVEMIAASLDIPFVRRPIDRTELLIADELSIAGTLAELVPIKQIADKAVDPQGPIIARLRQRFFDVVQGKSDVLDPECSFVPEGKIRSLQA